MTVFHIGGKDIAVSVYEVTFAEWDMCLAADGCGGYRPDDQGWGDGRRPVINVSYDHTTSYLTWLNERAGRSPGDPSQYRLPSVAEWEQAAGQTRYNWGNEPPNCRRGSASSAVFRDCMTSGRFGRGTQEVGFSAPTEGLYDMHGNAAEWTTDCADEACTFRIIKGGSWQDEAMFLETARREAVPASAYAPITGFRIVRNIMPQP